MPPFVGLQTRRAMALITWRCSRRERTFAKQLLVATPGITIRDRLGVLHPEREENFLPAHDLMPADLWDALLQAQRPYRQLPRGPAPPRE